MNNMNNNTSYTDNGWYYFGVTKEIETLFEKKRRYSVRPTELSTHGQYKSLREYENKKIKNPHFGIYEGYHHDVPRYGWPDNTGSVWVPNCHDVENELFYWNIFRDDGTIRLCFPRKPLIKSEDTSGPVIMLYNIAMYSPNDERVFLEWLFDVDYIELISGVDNTLRLHLVSNEIFASDLDELNGLFSRYQLDKQLLIF